MTFHKRKPVVCWNYTARAGRFASLQKANIASYLSVEFNTAQAFVEAAVFKCSCLKARDRPRGPLARTPIAGFGLFRKITQCQKFRALFRKSSTYPQLPSASSVGAKQGALSLERLPTIPPLIWCLPELQGTFRVIPSARSLLQSWAYVSKTLFD